MISAWMALAASAAGALAYALRCGLVIGAASEGARPSASIISSQPPRLH